MTQDSGLSSGWFKHISLLCLIHISVIRELKRTIHLKHSTDTRIHDCQEYAHAINKYGATSGAGTAYPSGSPESPTPFPTHVLRFRIPPSLVFCLIFCWPLLLFLFFFLFGNCIYHIISLPVWCLQYFLTLIWNKHL